MRYILIFTLIVFIACVIVGLLIFWKPANTSNISKSERIVFTDKPTANLDTKRLNYPKNIDTQYTDIDAFYQTIIDNNIFRPLNWEPPLREFAYILLGTFIAADGSSATAYIQERKSNRFYAVSVGQQVGEMTVKTIAPKRVTFTQNGESLTLAMNNSQFLNSRGSRSMSPLRDKITPRITKTSPTINITDLAPSLEVEQIHTQEERRKHFKEKVEAIRSERIRMMGRLQYLQQR